MNDKDSAYTASDRTNSNRPNLLADNDWRNANLDTLDVWHPAYHRIADRMVELHMQFYVLMKEYRDHLLTYTPDSEEDLLRHVFEEVLELHQERQNSAISAIWAECIDSSKQD
jgi:hypothetical protein